MNTGRAISELKQRNLSIALFAPCWTYENEASKSKKKFLDTEKEFWQGLSKLRLFDEKNYSNFVVTLNGG